jgi:hypothetical protein
VGVSNRTLLLLATSTHASTLGGYELVVESSQAEVKQQASAARAAPSPSAEDTLTDDSDGGKRAGLFLLFGVVSAATGYGAVEAFSLSYDQSRRYKAIERLPEAVEGEDPPGCADLADPNASTICSDSHGNAVLGVLAGLASVFSGMVALNQLMDPVTPTDPATKQAEAGRARSFSDGVHVRPIPIPNGIGVSVRF